MITRNERGKLELKTLDLSIFLDDLFEKCETQKEVDWLAENISGALEGSLSDKLDELGIED